MDVGTLVGLVVLATSIWVFFDDLFPQFRDATGHAPIQTTVIVRRWTPK